MQKLAIIVNTFQRPLPVLERCLGTISPQAERLGATVIIVDQNVEKLPLLPINAIHLHSPGQVISRARNVGVAVAKDADWVIFIDDDGVLQEGALDTFVEVISQKSDIDVVGGRILIEGTHRLYSPRQRLPESYLSFIHLKAVMGGLLGIRRSTFLELDGFDEEFGIGSKWGSGEESGFCIRAFLKNKTLYFLPKFDLIHPAPAQMPISKVHKYALGKGALIRKLWHYDRNPWLIIEMVDAIAIPIMEVILGTILFRKNKILVGWNKLSGRLDGFINYSFPPK